MSVRYFALVAGIAYTLVGILGFFETFETLPGLDAPPLAVDTGYALLFGIFPINLLHNLVHLGIGVWGIASYASFGAARWYARGIAIIYGLLAVMGLFPVLNTTFGLVPIWGADVWLHALTALIAAYFGWMAPGRAERRIEHEPVVETDHVVERQHATAAPGERVIVTPEDEDERHRRVA